MGTLVVSETDQLRNQLVDYLEGREFDPVHEAASPAEARGRLGLDGTDPDGDWSLLVVDLKGQDPSFLKLVEACRTEAFTRNVAVLALTRRADPNTVRSLLSTGCTDFLETPINETVLRHHARLVTRLCSLEADQGSVNQRIRNLEEELEAARDEISRLANLDELTKIPTHEQFQKALRKEWSRLRRSESPLALAMVDIDDFEDYGRNYGRETADERLVRVAEILEDQLKRPGDMVARFATAHFVVLLPETDRAGGKVVGENILGAVRALEVEHEGRPEGVMTVSVGIAATVPDRDRERGQLAILADDALGQARDEGGNRLVAHSLT